MEREIKFRAWDKVGNYFHPGFTLQEIIKIMTTQEPPGIECVAYQFGFRDFVLQQFTGLKDKNGKEIYEGDIVQFDTWSRQGVKEIVRFEGAGFMPFLDPHYCDDEQGEAFNGDDPFEIIGNIYENSELIN